MSKSIKELKPIPPNPPRWEPTSDPSLINIPGLDTTASVNDQIDQIDQLVTLKLQDIDANFSKMQQVLSNRILPAFKRFAIGTEPVREAAKFWTSFFEHAAQVHIPTSDNLSSMQEQEPSVTATSAPDDEPSTTTESTSATPGPSTSTAFDLNHTPSESSFLPAHAAVSSTPAIARAQAANNNNNNSTFFASSSHSTADPSWTALVESPLMKLNRELREFTRADPEPASISTTTSNNTTLRLSTPTRPAPAAAPRRAIAIAPTLENYEDDDEPTLPSGMSPPVMFPFARLGRSPAKSAATHIRHALLRSALRDVSASASGTTASASGGAAPTPPSLSRYMRGGGDASNSLASMPEDPELDSLMRRVSLLPPARTPPPPGGAAVATPESDNDGIAASISFSSSSSGEEDSIHNTAHPSAAFLLASRQRGRHDEDDNDDDDDEDDSLDADPDAATASFEPVHPFARARVGVVEDDSFDSLDGEEPEETVFGARPVKRGSLLPLGTGT